MFGDNRKQMTLGLLIPAAALAGSGGNAGTQKTGDGSLTGSIGGIRKRFIINSFHLIGNLQGA